MCHFEVEGDGEILQLGRTIFVRPRSWESIRNMLRNWVPRWDFCWELGHF